jgi:hypothetical protein
MLADEREEAMKLVSGLRRSSAASLRLGYLHEETILTARPGKRRPISRDAFLLQEQFCFEKGAYCCTPTADFSAGVLLTVVARAAKKLWSYRAR